MCVLSQHVNSRVRHYGGRSPKSSPSLRAFVGARLLEEHVLGIDSITKAAACVGVTRAAVKAAQTILQAGDTAAAVHAINGHVPLLKTAKTLANRAELIASFKAASAEDRIAFGHVVGVATLFDSAIVPAL